MTSTLDNSKRVYNEDSNQGQSGERHPHSENFSDDKGTENPSSPPVPADNLVDSLPAKHLEPHGEESNNEVCSYTIEPCFQNTANKYKDTSSTVPRLVLRVPSSDLTPKGWRSINCIIIGTYISALFCIFTGALANRYAWKAKRYQSKGFHDLVRRDTRRAVILIYVSIALGISIATIVIATNYNEWFK